MDLLKKEEMHKIKDLFEGFNETMIWSALQGYMGNAWVNNLSNPRSAQVVTSDFCFFVGIPDPALVRNIPSYYEALGILMIPQTNEWGNLIERTYPKNFDKFMRYSIKKEPEIFEEEKLLKFAESLPPELNIKQINEELYQKILKEPWSKDLCSQFKNYSEYKKYGLGYAVLHNNEVVSGASSYIVYDGGIEIEIDTKDSYRRKGLALACAAKLVLLCIEKHIYPSWDAASLESVALAEKIGYHFDKEYVTYYVSTRLNPA